MKSGDNKQNHLKPQRTSLEKQHSSKKPLSGSLDSQGHPHPHDLGMKRVFLKTYILRLFCQMIFAHANKKIEEIINWDTIEICKSDLVGQTENRSDFSTNVYFKNSKYKATILLFFEHFSHLDPKAMFRLLDYHAGFYLQEENKNRLVFSVVISQGVSGEKWNLPLTFQEDLQGKDILPKEYSDILGEYLVNFRTFLFDLQKADISKLNPILRPIFYVFKHIYKVHASQSEKSQNEFLKDVYRLITEVAEEMKTSPDIQEIFKDLRRTSKEFANLNKNDIIKRIIIDELEDIALYLIQYNSSITEDILKKACKEVFIEKGGKDYMEELDFTREGAKLKGIEIGRQKGRQEGLQAGRQEVALNLLKTTDMDVQAISKATGLSKQDIINLKKTD